MGSAAQAMATFIAGLEEPQSLLKIGAQPPAAAPGQGLGQAGQL